jgi:hypothetical protein
MIDLKPVIQRLKDARKADGTTLFRVVGGAVGYAAATKPGQALGDGPNAYVIPVADLPTTAPADGGPQVVQSEFQVQIFLRLHGDAAGFAKEEELLALEDALLKTLLGWRPAPYLGRLVLSRAGLSDFRDQELWWGMVFRTTYGLSPANAT